MLLGYLLLVTSFFILITLVRGWFSLSYWPFWVGGVIGTLLPDVDYFVYAYLLRPYELNSQRVISYVKQKAIFRAYGFMLDTRYEATKLIIHTIYFQVIFLILTFWVLTSSGSAFGAGLTLSFSLHLLIDQITDISQKGDLSNWFRELGIILDKKRTYSYWGVLLSIILFLGLFV